MLHRVVVAAYQQDLPGFTLSWCPQGPGFPDTSPPTLLPCPAQTSQLMKTHTLASIFRR